MQALPGTHSQDMGQPAVSVGKGRRFVFYFMKKDAAFMTAMTDLGKRLDTHFNRPAGKM